MADLQISQLPVLTSVAAVDELPIVDVSGSETRKTTAKDLVQQGVALIDAGSIPGSALASLGANSVVTTSITDGNVTNAKLQNSSFSLGGLTISLGSTDNSPALDLTDATNYPASSLSGTVSNAQLAGSIANNKLANSSISLAGVSINLGDTNATPTFNLTNATNYPASSLTGTVSNAQLAGSIANSKLVNSSINIGGVSLSLGDTDSSPAFDLSDATNYPTSSLSGTITNAQLAGSIQGSKILAGSISSTELGTNSVTAVELANLSVDTAALIDSSVTDVKISAVSGTKITAGSLPATALNASNLGTGLAISSNNLVINNTVSAGSAAKVTFSSVGLITGSASLAASDLPIADATNVGGISVGGGLSVTGAGALSLSNSISAATVSGIQFNAFGQIVSATSLASSDLPLSTSSQVGGVQITSGGGLSVDGSGGLSTSSSGISAGTYTKLTVNTKGVATAGQLLIAGDIPDIPATKLTTGIIDAGRIGAGTIDSSKLSNSSTAIIQSIAQLGFPTAGVFTGQLLFDPIAEDAYLWDGNAWNPITTLTKGALQRFGTYDANLSQVDSVTSAGAAAGLSIGANLPVASESVDGGYVVISVQGTPSGVAGITGQLSPPDYLLGVTNTGGSSWQEIDLSSTVASQVASQIGYTPFGQISSNNVQSAIDELETEKLAKTGGEVSGELLIGATGSLVFEGSTPDAFETKLVAQDPSVSDKILTLPNITGTLITTGDTDSVTSTMVDGSLTNTNLAANAAIAFTKLASLTAASILVGNASNEVAGVPVTGDISIDNAGLTAIGAGKIVNSMVSGTAAIDGSKVTAASLSASGTVQLNDSTNSTSTSEAATANALKSAFDLATTANTNAANAAQTTGTTFTGDVIIDNGKELRLSEADGDGANYTAFKAQAQSSDITLTLPADSPTGGFVLKANASTPTTLEWAADSATDNTKMPLAGGTFTNDVTFTGDASNGLWDKSASAFVANLTGNVTGNVSGTSGGFTAGSASNLDSGTVNVARLGSGSSVSTKFLRGDNSWQTVSSDLVNDTSPQLGGDLNVNSKNIRFGDSSDGSTGDVLYFGDGEDLKIYSEGTKAKFIGDIDFEGTFKWSDGSNYDALVWNESTNNLEFKDNNKLTFGTGAGGVPDLSIFSNGSEGILGIPDGGTLKVKDGSNTMVTFSGASNQIDFGVTTLFIGTASNAYWDKTNSRFNGTITEVNVTANNSTDETVYPLFADGATGSQGAESDTGLTYNPSSGLLTSTGFAGALTGNVTGTASGNAVLTGSTNNTIATVTGANALQGEANLTFDGSELKLPTGSGTQGLFFQASSGSNANLRGVGTNYGSLGFFFGNNEKVRFDSSGNVGIGTTSLGSYNSSGDNLVIRSSGTTGLTLSGGATDNCNIFFGNAEDTHVSAQINYDNDTNLLKLAAGESNGVISFCTVSSNERFRIGSAGQLGIAGANYGTDGQVLTSKGASAAPEWADAGGGSEITATASGAIAAGKGVIVNSSGSVSQATVTAAAFGSRTSMSIPDDMQGGTEPDHDIIWCEAHNCFVQVYKATSSNDYGRIRCGTLSGTTITWGSPYTYAADQCWENRCVYDPVNDLIIVAYRNISSSARVQVQQIKISGTTINSVSATATPNGSLGMSELGLATDGKGSCIITYRYSSNGKAQRVYANAATTGAPSFDSVQDIQGYSNNNFRFNSIAYSPDDDKFLCCWTDAANGRGVGRLITITGTSGSSLTFSSTPGSGNYFHTGGYPRDIKLVYNTNINKFVCVYNNSVRDMYARVGIISSGEIGWGTEVQITHATNMSSNYDPSHIFNPQSFKHSVYWKDGADSNKLKHADITISGTTPSMGSIATLESTYTNNEYSMAGVSNAGDEINVWQATGNGLQYIVRSGETTTLTSTNFIGFASAGYSNGNTATVKVVGNTLTGQSGLTGGTKVYVQRNGDISHTPSTPSVEAGTALTSTSLLIKG